MTLENQHHCFKSPFCIDTTGNGGSLMDKQTFRNKVSDYITKEVPRALIYNLDNFGIRMQRGDYWIDLTLDNFYQGYCRQNPLRRNQYLAEVLAPFIRDLRRGSGVNYLDVKENLYQVYPLVVGREDIQGIVTTQVAEDLHIAYVLDQGMRFFFLDPPTLKQLDFSVEKLNQIALKNFLRDLVKPLQLFDSRRKIYGFNYGDSYDSSRLLSLLLTPQTHGLSPTQPVFVMVPNRDVVMLFHLRDENLLRQAIMIGKSSFINNPYPISGSVFLMRRGVIQRCQGFWDSLLPYP